MRSRLSSGLAQIAQFLPLAQVLLEELFRQAPPMVHEGAIQDLVPKGLVNFTILKVLLDERQKSRHPQVRMGSFWALGHERSLWMGMHTRVDYTLGAKIRETQLTT